MQIQEGGVHLNLTLVDTPGFGDVVDNSNWWVRVCVCLWSVMACVCAHACMYSMAGHMLAMAVRVTCSAVRYSVLVGHMLTMVCSMVCSMTA